jgi:hypothetical protein
MARFKEQPAHCSKPGCTCRNPRHSIVGKGKDRLTIQGRRAFTDSRNIDPVGIS